MTINAHASGDGSAAIRCCRLCGGDTSLRGFSEKYVRDGIEESYDQLLFDCFSVRVYPPESLVCDHCVRQLRNIDRFRSLVHAAFVKQRSEYSSKHSHMGIGEGYACTATMPAENEDRTCTKEIVKLRKGKSKTIDVPKRREIRRDRRSSVLSTNVTVKRMNIACMMCNQRYPMIVPFEGWKEFVCSRCKKTRKMRTGRRSNVTSSIMRERLTLLSKSDLRGQSRLSCLPKRLTHLSKTETSTGLRHQKYECSLCPKKYVVAQHLDHHMKTVHGEKQTLQCSVCDKQVSSKVALDRHMRMHTGQPIYQCDVCMKTFKGKRTFQTHYLTHGK